MDASTAPSSNRSRSLRQPDQSSLALPRALLQYFASLIHCCEPASEVRQVVGAHRPQSPIGGGPQTASSEAPCGER